MSKQRVRRVYGIAECPLHVLLFHNMKLSRIALFSSLFVFAVAYGAACSDPDKTPSVVADSGVNDSQALDDALGHDAQNSSDAHQDASAAMSKEEFCAKQIAREARCNDGSVRTCSESTYTCVQGLLNATSAPVVLECFSNRACGVSDDSCIGNLVRTADDDSFIASCIARRNGCQDAGASFSDDYCAIVLSALKPAAADAHKACLAKPACTDVRPCFQAIFNDAGCAD